RIVAEFAQSVAQKIRIAFDARYALRFTLQHSQGSADRGNRGRRESRGKDERRGRVLQKNCKFLRDGDESTVRRNGLGEGTAPDIHVAGWNAEVLVRAAPATAQNAGGMRLIDHPQAAEHALA